MKTPSARATEKFLSGYNCAQAVLSSFCDGFGLDPDRGRIYIHSFTM